MKQFTKFLFSALVVLLAALLVACNGGGTQVASNDGGISGTGDGSSKSVISGASYKGPLIKGSLIKVRRVLNGVLVNDLFSANTLSNKGDYSISLDPSEFNSEIVSITTTGQFYDENTALYSDMGVELKALALLDISADQQQTLYINSLTHLAHDYTLQLLAQGETFTQASSLAKDRVLSVLSGLTGEQDIALPFNQISLINTAITNADDNAYLVYLSAVFSKATTIQQQTDSRFTAQDLFNTLIENVINDEAINNDTLSLLQTAHEQLDATAINQNLSAILIGDSIPTPQGVIDDISPGLAGPTGLESTHISGPPELRRFCYEGITDCSTPTPTGNVNNNGMYTYELHTAVSGSDYAAPRINQSARNNISLSAGLFNPSVSYDARLRKVWPDGQYSAWSEITFTTPP